MPACQMINLIKQTKRLLPAIILLVTISTDQYTKLLANRLIPVSDEISLFNGILQFSLIQNYGGFLGIVNSLPENIRFFLLHICVSLLLLSCLIYLFIYKKRTARSDILLAIITGGGTSNLLDRFFQNGGVTDFLSIGIGNFRTGIFNLADVYILTGSFILGYSLFCSFPESKQSVKYR